MDVDNLAHDFISVSGLSESATGADGVNYLDQCIVVCDDV